MDPLIAAEVNDVATAAAEVFCDVHLEHASPEVKAAAHATVYDLTTIAILKCLEMVNPKAP